MLKHILVWFFGTLIIGFALPAVISPSIYLSQVKKEQGALAESFGGTSAQKIIATADKTYTEVFEDSGIHQSFMEINSIPEKEILNNEPLIEDPLAPSATAKYERKMQSYFVSLFIGFYEWIFRMTQMMMWSAFSLPFIAAAAWDGLMMRNVKSVSFSYTSPAIYNGLWHGLIAMIFSVNLIFNIPFITMKPLIFPIIIAMLALLIRSLLSNLQRSA